MATQYSDSLDSVQCWTCLSVDRQLRPLAPYCHVFSCVMGDSNMLHTTQALICWECEAVLRSVVRFRSRVFTANSVLAQTHHASLSSLAITVQATTSSDEDANTINQKQDGGVIQKATDLLTDDEYDYADDPFQNSEDKPSVSEIKVETDPCDDLLNDETVFVKTERLEFEPEPKRKIKSVRPKAKRKKEIEGDVSDAKTKSKTKRALKKTLEKPRYNFEKTTDNTKEEDMYTRVAIDETELAECRARERDSEFFKKKKKKCEDCLLHGFHSKSDLQRHMTRHTKAAGNYPCDVCNLRFAKQELLAAHRESHLHKLVCRACSYEGCTSGNMSRHYRRHHGNTYRCRKCALHFPRRSEFTDHYKQMHERFICDHCGIQFKMRYMMIKHMRKRHLAHRCGECGSRYSTRYGLKVHRLRAHSSAAAGAAYCVECDMQFPNEFKYKNHLKTGARHKPRIKRFACAVCDKMFWKQCDLRAHRDTVHLKICRFRCDDCGQRFGRKCNLREHRRARHERRSPSRDHACRVCARPFTTKQSLKRHMMIHTGERPFVCALCSARFNQRSAMSTHVRNVHKPPPPPPPPHHS